MRTGGVTLDTALEDTRREGLRWFTMPQLHDEELPGNRPQNRPVPIPHRCRLCRQRNPDHTIWDCPSKKDCFYCEGRNHTHDKCPNPHVLCFHKSECVVPLTHRYNLTRDSRRCPAVYLHSQYYTDEFYDGEDGTYDDVDWEACDRGD
jgi:hypothetical protein